MFGELHSPAGGDDIISHYYWYNTTQWYNVHVQMNIHLYYSCFYYHSDNNDRQTELVHKHYLYIH